MGLAQAQSQGYLPTLTSSATMLTLLQYLLVRPPPLFKIIFVSPSLRIPGLLQSHFLSRIGGPEHIRSGISDAFASVVPVTAKVVWLPLGRLAEQPSAVVNNDSMSYLGSTEKGPHSKEQNAVTASQGKTRWLSCTPLLGSDDKPGVWMVVMVEEERGLSQPQSVGPVLAEKQGRTVLAPRSMSTDGRNSYEKNGYDRSNYGPSHERRSSYNTREQYATYDGSQDHKNNGTSRSRQYDRNNRSDRYLPSSPPPTEGLPSLGPPLSKYNVPDDERRPHSARGMRDQDSGYNSVMSPLGMNPARPSTSTATSRTYSLQSSKPPALDLRNGSVIASPTAGDLQGRRSNERNSGYSGGTGNASQRTSGNSGNSGGIGVGMSQSEHKDGSRGDLRTLRRGEFEGIDGSGARVAKERPDDLSDLSDGEEHGGNEEEDARNAEMLREKLERDR